MAIADGDFFELIQRKDVAGALAALAERPARDGAALGQRLGYVAWEMAPLHVAAATNQADAARLLVEQGADLAARTSTGLTPLALARQRHHDAAATLLSAPGASPVMLRSSRCCPDHQEAATPGRRQGRAHRSRAAPPAGKASSRCRDFRLSASGWR